MADYKDYYLHWTRDDKDAARLIELFGSLQHIADDFIDDEIESDVGCEMRVRSEKMTEMLHTCLVDIPLNPFYQRNSSWLTPIIASVLVQVNAADNWYDSDQQEIRLYSFVWRTAAEQLIYQIAYICGGLKHAQDVALEYRQIWLVDDDHSYANWEEEHVLGR